MTFMNARLSKIFEIMSFFDHFRWSSEENYNLINFFKSDLDDDTKLITHWLCYVTDRQMPFKIIWDVGGFVISELITEIKENKTINCLNPSSDNSFIGKEDSEKKYYLISKTDANKLIINNYPNYIESNKVKFKSRFFPSDYLAILYTIVFLKDYNFRLSSFIKEIYLTHKDNTDFIQRMFFCLYLVTYCNIGQPKSDNIGLFCQNIRSAISRKREIRQILDNKNKFNKLFNVFRRDRIYKQKRAWCSLRDFLKSPEFKIYFKNALREEEVDDGDFNRLFSRAALTQLELPGDVWNNNSKFRRCILKNTDYENNRESLNKILRKFFNKNPNVAGYPEQFDVTFDFVPRMCEQNNCDICPINKIDNNKNNFHKICLADEQKFCAVALVACNYKNNCIGKNECKIA